jgi:hypothetical protein
MQKYCGQFKITQRSAAAAAVGVIKQNYLLGSGI